MDFEADCAGQKNSWRKFFENRILFSKKFVFEKEMLMQKTQENWRWDDNCTRTGIIDNPIFVRFVCL